MKTKMLKTKILLSGLLVALATVGRAATNDLTAALQRGLFEEEANHNLPAAIQAYQSVIAQFDKDRKLAATAIFRLGECYRKQGSTNEAAAQYERIVREFSDQAPLVELSRQRLPAQGALAAGQPAASEEEKRLLDEEIKVAEQQLALKKQQYQNGVGGQDAVLTAQRDLLELRYRKAALDAGQPGASEEQRRLLDEEVKLAEQKLASKQQQYKSGFENHDAVTTAQQYLLELRSRRAALDAGQPASLAAAPPAATSAELEELARIQEMVRNSPDLINAAEQGGPTPLVMAAARGQLMVVQYLLGNGADVNLKSPPWHEPGLLENLNGPTLVETALCEAAGRGHLAIVQVLLEHGGAVDAPDLLGDTPLHRAAHAGFKSVVEALLAAKADVNARNGRGWTPLHSAAAQGFKGVAEVLLAAKADVNARNMRGDTPLHLAAAVGETALVELLLAHKAEVNIKNTGPAQDSYHGPAQDLYHNELDRTSGATPLVGAILGRHPAVVKLLLAAKAETNFECEAGGFTFAEGLGTARVSPLGFALRVSSPEIVALLLDSGANPNAQVPLSGAQRAARFPPLAGAASSGQREIAQLLLAHKADPNMPDAEGKTPLHWAVLGNHIELVKLLLASHAEINRQDTSGETPLSCAVLGHKDIAAALLEARANPDLKDQQGRTPLHRAWAFRLPGYEEEIKLLLANHADANSQDRSGRTVLSYAAEASNTDIAAALLDAKADPNLKDQNGQTPLFYAVQGHKEMVELLLAKGANPNARDHSGNTPLTEAKTFSRRRGGSPATARFQKEIAELLRRHGAIEELPRMDVIGVRRSSAKFSEVVFTKGTNNYNHFTLYQLIAAYYGFVTAAPVLQQQRYDVSSYMRGGSLAFPDWNGLTIRHPAADGLNWTVTVLHASDFSSQDADCSFNRPLQWGDVVEIPEADHPISAVWQGLPKEILANLRRCLARQVQLTVKGQTTNLLLSLQTAGPPGSFTFPPPDFLLWPVIDRSGLLRASSDLSRVTVKRRDAATGQAYELVFDCSGLWPGPAFWLENGDAIEVPEKP